MRRNFIIIISLICMLCFRFLPPIPGMSPSAMQVLGIFLGVLLMWLTISIDWPSMVCLAALTLVPELSMAQILNGSLGNSTVAFLIFTFMCTYAISKTTFVKRCAIMFISSPVARKSPWMFMITYCASVMIIGLVMSPSVVFVIYLPIMKTICDELKLEKDDKLANALMMGQLFCAAFSCGMTPIAHVFSIMAMGFYQNATGLTIGYGDYMAFAIPVGIICFMVMILIFRFILKPDMTPLHSLNFDGLRADVARADRREHLILIIFFLVVAMWVLPEFTSGLFPGVTAFFKAQGTAFPPLIGAAALCLITLEGKPLMNFKESMQKGVEWGSIIMAGATLSLGSAMTNSEIGLTNWLSDIISPVLSGISPIMLVFIFALWAALMTNLASNMVTVTVVCAVSIPICMASDGLISTPAVAMIVGMLGGYAFVTPPAHPNVPLAIGSGWTRSSQIIIYGSMIMAASVAASVLAGYPIARMLMGV